MHSFVLVLFSFCFFDLFYSDLSVIVLIQHKWKGHLLLLNFSVLAETSRQMRTSQSRATCSIMKPRTAAFRTLLQCSLYTRSCTKLFCFYRRCLSVCLGITVSCLHSYRPISSKGECLGSITTIAKAGLLYEGDDSVLGSLILILLYSNHCSSTVGGEKRPCLFCH